MKHRNVLVLLNVLLLLVMVVHVGILYAQHSMHPEWSAPAYVELLNVVYYLVPFAALHIIGFIVKRRKASSFAQANIE